MWSKDLKTLFTLSRAFFLSLGLTRVWLSPSSFTPSKAANQDAEIVYLSKHFIWTRAVCDSRIIVFLTMLTFEPQHDPQGVVFRI
jgi:hypothetical protein